jgi:hypothetical protein
VEALGVYFMFGAVIVGVGFLTAILITHLGVCGDREPAEVVVVGSELEMR